MPFFPPLYLNEWGGWSVVTGATTLLHVCAERRQTAAAEIQACPLLSAIWTEARIDLPDLLASGLSRLNVWTDADVDRKSPSLSLYLSPTLSLCCTLHCETHSLVLPHPLIAAAAAAAVSVAPSSPFNRDHASVCPQVSLRMTRVTPFYFWTLL